MPRPPLTRSIALLALLLPLAAGAASRLLGDYAHTAWTSQRGAPNDVVKFAQTPDGWLWLASPNGLFRFDGVSFERMDSVQGQRLHSTNTMGLLASRDGRLWIGHRFGGISMVHQGRLRLFQEADGLPPGAVFSITEGPDGSVWAATTAGLGMLAPGASRFRRIGAAEGLPEKGARQILYGRNGRQWVSVDGGIYYRDPGQPRYRRAWPHLDLMAMAEAPDGTLWASDGTRKQYRVLAEAPPGNPTPRAELEGNGSYFDRSGTMWVLKAHVLERRVAPYVDAESGGAAQQLSRENGISGPLPQTVFEDREGNLWIGTSSGIDRLRRSRLHNVPVETAFDHPSVLADPQGGVIIGDILHPVRRFSASGAGATLFDSHILASYRAPDGSLWFGNNKQRWRRAPDGALTQLAHPPEHVGHDVQAMSMDGGGRMWVSLARKGLYLADGAGWRKDGGLPGLPDGLALSLATDAGGRIWAGYLRNRIAVIDGAGVQVFDGDDGLQLGNVQSLHVDGARIWAGGEQGVAWHDGRRWHALTLEGGEPLRGISGLVRTRAGELWLHGSDGITRIAAPEVERLLREPKRALPFERFNALDGLVGSAEQLRPLPTLAESADGRLWFATASEVATIDPAHIARSKLAPPVQIVALRAAGASHAPQENIKLPTGARDLQIAYTALSLTMPERVRFRYKLEGVDEDWQDAGTRREAFYTRLAPGAYTFRVIAANHDGVWNQTGASLRVTLPPRFVETPWFTVLMVLAGALTLAALYLLRVRSLTARMRDLSHERLQERERIARGLHDTLLQSVQSLIMFFDQQSRRLPLASEERRKIEQTLELADELMTEGRDYIMDLRTAAEPEELGQALRQYGGVLLHERFTASIHGTPRVLTPLVREEVHAIAREALFNAARHAQARKVELIMDYRPDALALLVRDDGVGMRPDEKVPGHYGLAGMRERAAAIGAACTVFSAPGKGTSVHLEIPADAAYPGRRSATLMGRLRERLRAHAKAA